MTELQIQKIEKEDIQAPQIEPGGTAIVLQRHELYDRNRDADTAGSILPEESDAASQRDIEFFQTLVNQEQKDPEDDRAETMVLFVSSDTQYAGKGRRSMQTAQLAQDAAKKVFEDANIDPASRILNLNPDFSTKRFGETDQDIRPSKGLVEPQIFDNPEFMKFMRDKYGVEEGAGTGFSKAGWAAYEADEDREVREEMGVEGVYDILDRTKKSVSLFERYAQWFHSKNPNKRLVIWAASHYDTISPLVKDATNTPFTEYVRVDYGGGVVINVAPNSREAVLEAQSQKVALDLGNAALTSERQ